MIFTNILKALNIEYITEGHHHCREGWVQLDCPFCAKDSKGWHLGYSLENNFIHCWRCGPHSLIDTLMEITDLSFRECKKLLDGIESVEVERKEKPKGKLIIPKGVKKLHPSHIRYLRRRGFDARDITNLWKIKGIGLLVGGTFEKDQLRGVSNYSLAHISDTKLLKDLDDYFYENLNGDSTFEDMVSLILEEME